MTDVALTNAADGGEITVAAGQIAMSIGLDTAAYLSLFGGNEDDSGLPVDASKQWWGNQLEPNEKLRYRSETQYQLRNLPATPANLVRIEDAASHDLDWMVTELGAIINVSASMPAFNRIAITGTIKVDGKILPLNFNEPWGVAQ